MTILAQRYKLKLLTPLYRIGAIAAIRFTLIEDTDLQSDTSQIAEEVRQIFDRLATRFQIPKFHVRTHRRDADCNGTYYRF